ncbi:MAG: arsenate reductase [Porphyrobacter sp.]|nr:arsenate reductase [Porphyrobacter sp.]
MTMILYGIANCDAVRKARRWLDARGVAHAFHDYKKQGADPAKLAEWSAALGWEALLNRRGTTFRKLEEAETADLDESRALRLMAANPSLIRRPVVEHGGGLLVGFDEAEWQRVLA